MCKYQLPPFLLFGIVYTFIYHPWKLRRQKDNWEDFESEDVRRIKRRIEVRWGYYCILSLLLWIAVIAGVVVLIVKTTSDPSPGNKTLVQRWMSERLRESLD